MSDAGVPDEVLSDCYIDFEVTRWGYAKGPTVWIEGRTPRVRPMKQRKIPGAKLQVTDLPHEVERDADIEDL